MSLDPQEPATQTPAEPSGVDSPADVPAMEVASTPSTEPVTETAAPASLKPLPPQPIVARSGQYYRNTRYIMTAVTIIMGFWFLYDGFVRYPAENRKIEDLVSQQEAAHAKNDQQQMANIGTEMKKYVKHSDTDLLFQRVLAFVLPPASIALLLWAIYNSRGEYRLNEDVLYVPGHPPLPLASIRELDETIWDRKGIAYVRYTTDANVSGKIRLDDFVYERKPTDQIVEWIKRSLTGGATETAVAETPVT